MPVRTNLSQLGSAFRFRQNSGISLPGFCFTVVLGPGAPR
jgi:hypothetical protein